jgi:hypothetical protein
VKQWDDLTEDGEYTGMSLQRRGGKKKGKRKEKEELILMKLFPMIGLSPTRNY